MHRLTLASLLTATTLASALALTIPDRAEACGGTFCDSGPNAMPVDQTGENILFVIDGEYVEAHIQIQYDPNTPADKFAWVIPVTALPEFSVGSQLFFDNLLAGSVPFYGFQTSQEICGENPNGPPQDSGADPGVSTGTSTDGAGDSAGEDGGPDVLYSSTVGAFDIVVLQDDNVASLMKWLGDNGYQQDPKAEPIFAEYLEEGHLFVAFKLTNNAEVAEIHPVVLRYKGDESCVPIRLTRIAADEDMDIRAFFLANARTVPTNYRHVLVNPLRLDWINFAANYKEVISLAVDAFGAEGNAFVTEYAGNSNVVQQFGIHEASWNSAAFSTAAAVDVVDLLSSQGLLYCYNDFDSFCQYNHPLLSGLLARYLPVPDGMTDAEFYSCLSCNEAQIDLTAWDPALFSKDLEERLIAPGKHAVDLLNTWPYLTRMYTTISPAEMLEDPIFRQNPNLPEVPSLRNAQALLRCDGHGTWTLPDGREVFVPNNGPWPDFDVELPYEEEVQQTSIKGAPMTIVNNTAAINKALDDWNRKMDPVEGQLPPGAEPGDTDTDTDTGTGGSSGGLGGDDQGCNCDVNTGTGGMIASLGLLGLLGLRRRRG
jgi:MYXO-CTERM domain-containing protein